MDVTPPRKAKLSAKKSLTKLLGKKGRKNQKGEQSDDSDRSPTEITSPVTRSATAAGRTPTSAAAGDGSPFTPAFGGGKYNPVERSPPASATTKPPATTPAEMPGSKSDGATVTNPKPGGSGKSGAAGGAGGAKAPPPKPPAPGAGAPKPPPTAASAAKAGGTQPTQGGAAAANREAKLEAPTAKAKLARLALERKVRLVEQTITVVLNTPSRSVLKSLEKNRDDLIAALDRLEDAYNDLALADVPGNIDKYENKLTDCSKEAVHSIGRANDTCSRVEQVLTQEELRAAAQVAREGRPPTPPPPSSPKVVELKPDATAKPPAYRTHKANDALKPKTLTRDFTPVEFSMWSQRFKAYYTSSHMETLSLNEQQAYFFACLEAQLVKRIERMVNAATPIFPEHDADSGDSKATTDGGTAKATDGKTDGDGTSTVSTNVAALKSCMELLDEVFVHAYPLYNRRLNYLQAKKPSGRSASEWIQDMLRERDECNLTKQSEDEAFVHRILSGLNDQALGKELMKHDTLSVSKLIGEVGRWESNKKSLSQTYQTKPGGSTANVSVNKSKGSGKSKTPTTTQSTQGNKNKAAVAPSKKSEFQCYRCGQRDKDHVCKAKDSTCRKCQKQGHYAGMCKSKLRAKVNAAQAAAAAEAATNATVAK